jgi:photosystem II stability/assembly factor-like uncharacterized protein
MGTCQGGAVHDYAPADGRGENELMAARERVLVLYRVAVPLMLILLLLAWLDEVFPGDALQGILIPAMYLVAFGAPVAWVVALTLAVQHRREWRLVLPLALFVLAGVLLTCAVFLDSPTAAYVGGALLVITAVQATWIGWAPVLARPRPRFHPLGVLRLAASRASDLGTRLRAFLVGEVFILAAIIVLSSGKWRAGAVALLLGVALGSVNWRLLSRFTGRAITTRTHIAALAVLALLALAAITGRHGGGAEHAADPESAAGELPAEGEVDWCGVWGSGATVIVVGAETIRRSTDGGSTWRSRATGTSGSLCGVGGSASIVVVVGQWGALLRSTDGGTTWSRRDSGSDRHWLHGVWVSDSLAFAVGGDRLIRSLDAGSTWSPLPLPDSMRAYDLTETWGNRRFAVVASKMGIYRSTDGGGSWARVWRSEDHVITGTWGAGDTILAVGSRRTIIRSADGGATWTRVLGEPSPPLRQPGGSPVDTHPSPYLRSVAGSGSTFVAVGARGAMLRSTDGGATWGDIDSGTMHHLSAIWGSDSLFVAVGSAGTILVSRDGGARWAMLRSSDQGATGQPVNGKDASLP